MFIVNISYASMLYNVFSDQLKSSFMVPMSKVSPPQSIQEDLD